MKSFRTRELTRIVYPWADEVLEFGKSLDERMANSIHRSIEDFLVSGDREDLYDLGIHVSENFQKRLSRKYGFYGPMVHFNGFSSIWWHKNDFCEYCLNCSHPR